jgi:EAL domain-containing protein (putative c-di-GMP-specific phosphodiesterase class I)
LTELRGLPIDALKVDRSLVASIDQPDGDPQLVQAFVGAAHAMNMEVSAEGIEREAQLNMLRTMSCDFGQGHYFGPALPAEQVAELLRRQDDERRARLRAAARTPA